jgi:hypothetical protein
VREDKQSCIKQAANPCDREAQKHIDVRVHYLREQVHQNNATMNYVSTHEQVAAALSKKIPKPAPRKTSQCDGARLQNYTKSQK